MPEGREPVTRKQFELGQENVNVITGERIGNQIPTNLWVPEYTRTRGDKAIAWLDAVGIHLDAWQQFCLREMLGERPDGKWSAKEIVLLVSRQQGKTLCAEARELVGLFLFGEKLVIHCLDVDTPILTRDDGWKRICELTTDDYVFHPSGSSIRVTGTSPVWLNQNCFKVTTTDGREVVVDADHLWTVNDRRRVKSKGPRGTRNRWFQEVTLTTKEMYDGGIERWPNRDYKGLRYVLPHQGAVELPEVDLPIDPYVLGAWLGDGTSRGGTFTSQADDMPWWRAEFARLGYETTQHKAAVRIGVTGLMRQLRGLNLLRNKHIPQQYLLASPRQREALLQGLVDTDGSTPGGRTYFVNANKQIAEGVLFLARSLGWRATILATDPPADDEKCLRTGFRQTQTLYRVTWSPKSYDDFCPARMPRKVDNLVGEATRSGRHTFCIEKVEPVESRPVSCVQVDSPDGLFLAGKCLIPTHNSAQLFPTAHESYIRMCQRIRNCPDLMKHVHKMRSGNNNVGIELKNGARILYMARGKDPGKGFSGDLIVFDEAYNLNDDMIGALIPTLSARPNPQILYTSSTGDEDSTVLLKARDRGIAHQPGIALFEWCADSGCNLDDVDQWYQANPALGIRIDIDFVRMEREALGDKMFARERLGLWADNSLRSPIDAELWKGLKSEDSQISSRVVLAVDAAPDRSCATIALAGYTEDGRKQVEVESSGRGISWCVDAIDQIYKATTHPQPLAVCVQAGARAGALIPELEALGIEVIPIGQREIMSSTGFLYDSCEDGSLVHLGDPTLTTGLAGARQYFIGGKVGDDEYNGWGWSRADTTVDITGVCAITYALWGLNMKRAEAVAEKKHYEGKPRGGRIW